MTLFKPMLAAKQPPYMSKATYLTHICKHLPLVTQAKLDGIRCLIDSDGNPRSRTWKLIQNRHIRTKIKELALPFGFDGELLTLKSNNEHDNFNDCSSKVMSHEGEPRFIYWVFDWFRNDREVFTKRHESASRIINRCNTDCLALLYYNTVHTTEQLDYAIEQAEGTEGIILRHPQGYYKQGRATLNQMWLTAYKFWQDTEGVVVGFEELQHNFNEESKDVYGYIERSSGGASMMQGDTLGSLIVTSPHWDLAFNVGTGFSANNRQHIWNNKDKYMNKTIKFKYQATRTKKERPISPVFLGWRDE